MARTDKRLGEFELIAKYFAPLAADEPGAFGLKDDAACLRPRPGHDLVVTTDAIVAGIHFYPDDPPDTIARKLLRVNISDLAAKGARPRAYLLTTALPGDVEPRWLAAFARGLRQDQRRYGCMLVGGDTVSTPGPMTLSVTAIGEVAQGAMIERSGAKAGDDVWVTGTIGDAGLGLRILKGMEGGLGRGASALVRRYRVPEPRLEFGLRLVGLAHAGLDVSDGLAADCGHLAEVSRVAVELAAEGVPLSPPAAAAVRTGRATLGDLLTAGDDYELVFAAAPASRARLAALGEATKTRVTRIGRIIEGKGIRVMGADGRPLALARAGFTHF
jgi:thiamine-monophosphate kinase